MKLLKLNYGVLRLALLAFVVSDIVAAPVGTAFTYQGRLKSAGQPANGNYDLRFTLYDAASGGGPVGSPVTRAPVIVTNGNFTVLLDFGAVFDGEARWLEIGVRTNGSSSSYSTPSARQPLTPAPYALYAPSAGLAATATTAVTASNLVGNLSGDVTGTQTATVVARVGGQTATDVASGAATANAATSANTPDRIVKRDASGNFSAGTITAGSFTGDGAGLTGLKANQLTSGTVPDGRLAGIYSSALTLNNAGNSFTGNGAGLMGLNANNLATGTVADGRLSGNVALLNANQTVSGSNIFAGVSTLTNANNRFVGTFSGNGAGLTNLNAGQSLSGNGAGLTNLNASELASGTVPSGRLSGSYAGALTFNNAANSIAGNGSALTALDAGNLASGTVPGARLSGTYSSAVTFNNAANSFSGSGAGLTSLNADSLASGTVPGARLSGMYSSAVTFNNAANSFSGSGAGLTSLNAGALASGTVPSAQLSGTYSSAVIFSNAANSFSGNGAGLTNLNAGSLTSGTVPSARLSGTYSNAVTFNNASNSFSGNGAGLTNLNADSLASGTVPSARLSGTYASAVTFNNAGNSFSGNGSGLTNTGLARTTVLNVNCSGSGVSYSTAYTKVADIGTFTKLLANSTVEVTFNGRTYVTGMSFGALGAIFELRVDNTPTSNGRARASYRYSEASTGAGVQTSITGIFTGLAAATHTVSMWVQAAGAGASGTGAQLDPGCWGTDHLVVKELK